VRVRPAGRCRSDCEGAACRPLCGSRLVPVLPLGPVARCELPSPQPIEHSEAHQGGRPQEGGCTCVATDGGLLAAAGVLGNIAGTASPTDDLAAGQPVRGRRADDTRTTPLPYWWSNFS
jgi:hypothetical protein